MAENLRQLIIQIEDDYTSCKNAAIVKRKLDLRKGISTKISEGKELIKNLDSEAFRDLISTTEIKKITARLTVIENSLAKDKAGKR
ncbi:MAG: hypothetical protein QF460_02620 [Candidatus Nanoarchaeia archaeon]|jgi:hypothetical protein|nr:hypothetical protein [Candidatus Nanoarchaeia archaeon]|tara:strand:- start:31 stop:288 length:258 start_codon:yes stop_codon:yes gene_type:complete